MIKVRVCGVPEHFNYPWHYGVLEGLFEKNGFKVVWSDVKGGSGAMCKMLENDEADIALVLTEGIVKHIHNGGAARIIQQYVKSPLVWGVHSSIDRSFNETNLSKARVARSRVGSGSHLMAYVHAEEHSYDLNETNFVTVGNIDGAIEAFDKDTADILLWEKFMTQPYVDRGEVKRIGTCVSPWPCFMLVGSGKFLENSPELIERFCKTILDAAELVTSSKDTTKEIAKMYDLELREVEKWYASVEWQSSAYVSRKMLLNVISTLQRVGLLKKKILPPQEMCYTAAKLY